MYRRAGPDGYGTSPENKYGYKSAPIRMTEKKSDFSSDNTDSKHQDRDDVYIRSRTFQNSNWRQPNSNALEKAPTQFDNLSKKDIAIANSFMPHFCSKKESNYMPTLKAVDNLTPKFVSMDLNSDCEVPGNVQQPPVKHQSGASSSGTFRQNNGQSSWRKPNSNCNKDHTGLSYNIRRKFDHGFELTTADKKVLNQQTALLEMLGSKRSLYEALNELDAKTLKVQMDDFKRCSQSCDHLKHDMMVKYPECNVTPYGIRLLGMAHPKSAIYMFFDSDGKNYFQATHENKDRQHEIRKSVYVTMLQCGHCENVRNWDQQELITFTHSETQMSCVVSFSNGFKDKNTQLLKSYLTMDKRLRLLMLLVNDLLYRYHDTSKHFTSYVLNIMVIAFLQQMAEPVVPSLQQLRTSYPYEKVIIGGFDCGFPQEITFRSTNELSVEILLKEFCHYYSNYKFEEDVVSILGPDLKRGMFCAPFLTSPTSIEPLQSYLKSLKIGENVPKINCDLAVIVQDPFELSCNAAEKVNCTVLAVFKMMCREAHEILSKWC